MRESQIQTQITKWLDARAIKWSKAITNSKSGDSDLVICYKGAYVGCEVKKPGKKPTKIQAEKLWLVYKSGGLAFWVDNLDDFVSHLEKVATINCVQHWYVEPKNDKEVLEL